MEDPLKAAAARLRELLGSGPSSDNHEVGTLIECCTDILKNCGGVDPEAPRAALEALSLAVGVAGDRFLCDVDAISPLVVARLGDADASVREAARRFLVALMEMKERDASTETTEPHSGIIDDHSSTCMTIVTESSDTNQPSKKPKAKIITREIPVLPGEDVTKRVEPIKVYSERELMREIEKVASTLQPDKEWSVRITAMQRVEALVLGGAADYSAFPMLLKQLVTPVITQLLDRRSSIVKQACHLLSFLSRELLRDFEPCAELLIPVLLKVVVITVLVIAESADSCIREMLCNCKVARILPRIIEYAKYDRSAILRARCCEYSLLMLEYWVDTPEIQRSADLYEELIKCCIADATSEVRSTTRSCYRIFSRIWPERSCVLFSSFDPARQKAINDEESDMHKKYVAPPDRAQSRQTHPSLCIPSLTEDSTAAVTVEKCITFDSSTSLSSTGLPMSIAQLSQECENGSFKSTINAGKGEVSGMNSSYGSVDTLEKETVADSRNSDLGVNSLPPCGPISPLALPETSPSQNSSSDATAVTIVQDKLECSPTDCTPPQIQDAQDISETQRLSPPFNTKPIGNLTAGSVKGNPLVSSDGKLPDPKVKKHSIDSIRKGEIISRKEPKNNYVPHFQRPLLSKQMTNWFFDSSRNDLDNRQLIMGEMASSIDVPSSLTEALSLGLNPRSDWMMRVFAFNFLQSLLQRGPKGIQEVAQSFEKVMKLVSKYLDDPHHKIAQAALSSLAAIIPAFKKPFESYLERMLPHVFTRQNDPKDSVRQQCSTILKLVGDYYNIESLLPALLRSLDEQKSPKAKLAVIEFANCSFDKCAVNADIYFSNNFLKLWLGKLEVLCKDTNNKNNKLKEVALAGFTSVYSHYDPTTVLSFVVSLPVEDQRRLRRALNQLIPAMELDFDKFLQQKKQRQHLPSFDPFSMIGRSLSKSKHEISGAYAADNSDSMRKVHSNQVALGNNTHDSSGVLRHQNLKVGSQSNAKDVYQEAEDSDSIVAAPSGDTRGFTSCDDSRLYLHPQKINALSLGTEELNDMGFVNRKLTCDGPGISHVIKQASVNQMEKVSKANEHSAPVKSLNQVSFSVLEMLDDPDSAARELALSLLVEILEKQRKAMEDCIEMLILKLLHAIKDADMKVLNQAHRCLTVIVTQYDPSRCLTAVAPFLVLEDEKILIISINSLTKLVSRFSQEELMTQLPAFIPALLDAFENHSPYVRKTVVLCLVDVYLKLGRAFLPYLERLDSAQLQLITTYANRLSQTRVIAVDA